MEGTQAASVATTDERRRFKQRLTETARAFFDTMHVEPGPDLDERIAGLIGQASETIVTAGGSLDAATTKQTEARLVYLLSHAALAQATDEERPSLETLRAFPERTTTLDVAAFDGILRAICPLFPFCR